LQEEVNLIKKIGVPPPGARNNNLALTTQKTDFGNNQLVPENMLDIGLEKERVLQGIQKNQQINQALDNRL
jgi:hypothetical protein